MPRIDDYRKVFDLTGRKAIVTGGSRGIGKALADGLAAHGADVAIVVKSSVDRAEKSGGRYQGRWPRCNGDQGRCVKRGRRGPHGR